MNKKCVSSRDVAKEAGVSQATVSYVLNNVKNIKIKPETKKAVLEAAKKLNYHPNFIARGMKLNKSMSIGVVTARNVTNFYFMKTLEGIKDGLQSNNYSITLIFSKPGELSDNEFIGYYNSNRLDGIIFAFDTIDENTVNYMSEKGIPFVMVDINRSGYNVYEVFTDLVNHISDITEYLKSHGIRSVGYAGPDPKGIRDTKVENLRIAAAKCGISFIEENIAYSIWDDDEIAKAMTGLLTWKYRPEAVIAGTPRFGLFTAKVATMMNIKVPDELRIISLGSSNFYKLTHPSLSAVEVPLYDMGYLSAEKLLEMISGIETEKITILPSELVIRESS